MYCRAKCHKMQGRKMSQSTGKLNITKCSALKYHKMQANEMLQNDGR